MKKILIIFIVCCGCGDPYAEMDKMLKEHGYIAFTSPMSETGTGTLVGKNTKQLQFVAPAESCFPFKIEGEETRLRIKDDTQLPVRSKVLHVNADMYFKLFEKLKVGAPSIKAGVHLNKTSRLDFFVEGAQAEMMDHIKLTEFYRNQMPSICKEYLDVDVAFIIQALKITQMHFSFYDDVGGRIYLSLDNIKEFLDIQVDVKWHIEDNFTLIVDTPKYIGYQLGLLKEDDNGLALWRARKERFGKPVFEKISRSSIFHTHDSDQHIFTSEGHFNEPIPIEAIFVE